MADKSGIKYNDFTNKNWAVTALLIISLWAFLLCGAHTYAVNMYNQIQALEYKANEGDASAKAMLGMFYRRGEYVQKDKAKAKILLTEAAEAQDPLGLYEYAAMMDADTHDLSADTASLYREAIDAGLEDLANAGLPYAQCDLALCYEYGAGVEKNLARSVSWINKAAQQGYPRAQVSLGRAYLNGSGVETNLEQSLLWFSKAAEAGHLKAQYLTGAFYEEGHGVKKDSAKSYRWYSRAAQQGHPEAQWKVGMCLINGAGVQKNLGKGVDWFRRSAENGSSMGAGLLGVSYFDGIGVRQNKSEAFPWLQKAAKENNDVAQYYVGISYMNGDGIERNYELAKQWLEASDKNGYSKAQQTLQELAKTQQASIQFEASKNAPPFDFSSVKSKANSIKGSTFVFKGFFLGMPAKDALGLINHYMGLKQPPATVQEVTASSQDQVVAQAMLQAYSSAYGELGVSLTDDAYQLFKNGNRIFIARSATERPFAILGSNGSVAEFELSKKVSDKLFSAGSMPTRTFLEKFMAAYKIPELSEGSDKVVATLMGTTMEVGVQKYLFYRSSKGFEVKYYQAVVVFEAGSEPFIKTAPEGSIVIKQIETAQQLDAMFD